jgi:2-C-methyl-D-erythritol 4-phosphate cytidylyltransferase
MVYAGTLSAVVLAAGRGQRMKQPVSKVYLPLGGRPVLSYSLEKFIRCEHVEEIVLVIRPEDEERLRSDVLDALPFALEDVKTVKVVPGGERRQDSAQAGVRAARGEWVAVHDGARPFFSLRLLDSLFEAARAHRAAIPTLPLKDSVHTLNEEGFVVQPLKREGLHIAQTPQCFERLLLERALEEAEERGLAFTDEAAAVLAMEGVRAIAVPGEEQNIKITTPWDLQLAEALLRAGLA